MAQSDLYLHYKEKAREASTLKDFDRIIESAFNDYMRFRLTDAEYGRIYFACIARQNEI